MKCRNCGVDNPPEMNFCVNCGSSLKNETPSLPNPKASKAPVIIAISLGVVFLLALILIVGIAVLKYNKAENGSIKTTTITEESDKDNSTDTSADTKTEQEETGSSSTDTQGKDLSTLDLKEYVTKEKADFISQGIVEEKADASGSYTNSDKSISIRFYDNNQLSELIVEGDSKTLPAFFGVKINDAADTIDSKLKTDFTFLYSENTTDGNTKSYYLEKNSTNIFRVQNDTKTNLVNAMVYVTYGSTDMYEGDVSEGTGGTTIYNEEYILPDSDIRVYTYEELFTLTDDQIRIAINEIYARHGRKFKDANLQSYFDSQSWYTGSISADSFDDSVLNQNEVDNAYRLSNIQNNTLPVYNPDILGIYVYEDENLYYTITINSTDEEDVLYIDAIGSSSSGASGSFSGYMYVSDFYDTYYQSDVGYLSIYYTNQQITISNSTSTFGGAGFYGFDGIFYKTTDFQ